MIRSGDLRTLRKEDRGGLEVFEIWIWTRMVKIR